MTAAPATVAAVDPQLSEWQRETLAAALADAYAARAVTAQDRADSYDQLARQLGLPSAARSWSTGCAAALRQRRR